MADIKMLKNQTGSTDGISVDLYKEGEYYEVSDELADVFVNQLKCAEYDQRTPVPSNKAVSVSPENKGGEGSELAPPAPEESDEDKSYKEELIEKAVALGMKESTAKKRTIEKLEQFIDKNSGE